MRAVRIGNGAGVGAAAQVKSMNKKFGVGPDPLQQESRISIITPTDEKQQKQLLRAIDHMKKGADDQKLQALEFLKQSILVDNEKDEIRLEFLRRFQFWLLGRGTDEDTKKTLWGRGNVAAVNKGVREYIEMFAKKRLEYSLKLAAMSQRVPDTLNGYYLYFKYIVNGELVRGDDGNGGTFWDMSNDNFLSDFEALGTEFDDIFESPPYFPQNDPMKQKHLSDSDDDQSPRRMEESPPPSPAPKVKKEPTSSPAKPPPGGNKGKDEAVEAPPGAPPAPTPFVPEAPVDTNAARDETIRKLSEELVKSHARHNASKEEHARLIARVEAESKERAAEMTKQQQAHEEETRRKHEATLAQVNKLHEEQMRGSNKHIAELKIAVQQHIANIEKRHRDMVDEVSKGHTPPNDPGYKAESDALRAQLDDLKAKMGASAQKEQTLLTAQNNYVAQQANDRANFHAQMLAMKTQHEIDMQNAINRILSQNPPPPPVEPKPARVNLTTQTAETAAAVNPHVNHPLPPKGGGGDNGGGGTAAPVQQHAPMDSLPPMRAEVAPPKPRPTPKLPPKAEEEPDYPKLPDAPTKRATTEEPEAAAPDPKKVVVEVPPPPLPEVHIPPNNVPWVYNRPDFVENATSKLPPKAALAAIQNGDEEHAHGETNKGVAAVPPPPTLPPAVIVASDIAHATATKNANASDTRKADNLTKVYVDGVEQTKLNLEAEKARFLAKKEAEKQQQLQRDAMRKQQKERDRKQMLMRFERNSAATNWQQKQLALEQKERQLAKDHIARAAADAGKRDSEKAELAADVKDVEKEARGAVAAAVEKSNKSAKKNKTDAEKTATRITIRVNNDESASDSAKADLKTQQARNRGRKRLVKASALKISGQDSKMYANKLKLATKNLPPPRVEAPRVVPRELTPETQKRYDDIKNALSQSQKQKYNAKAVAKVDAEKVERIFVKLDKKGRNKSKVYQNKTKGQRAAVKARLRRAAPNVPGAHSKEDQLAGIH